MISPVGIEPRTRAWPRRRSLFRPAARGSDHVCALRAGRVRVAPGLRSSRPRRPSTEMASTTLRRSQPTASGDYRWVAGLLRRRQQPWSRADRLRRRRGDRERDTPGATRVQHIRVRGGDRRRRRPRHGASERRRGADGDDHVPPLRRRRKRISATPVFTSTVKVSGNGDYDSESLVPKRPGSYPWVAVIAGATVAAVRPGPPPVRRHGRARDRPSASDHAGDAHVLDDRIGVPPARRADVRHHPSERRHRPFVTTF